MHSFIGDYKAYLGNHLYSMRRVPKAASGFWIRGLGTLRIFDIDKQRDFSGSFKGNIEIIKIPQMKWLVDALKLYVVLQNGTIPRDRIIT